MRANQLRIGMDVAVNSRSLGLGDQFGPMKATVKEISVPNAMDSASKRNKTALTVYNRDGSVYGTCYVDGKNILAEWSQYKDVVEERYNKWQFEQTKAAARRKAEEEILQRKVALGNQIYLLLANLGIIEQPRKCYGYGKNVTLNLGGDDNPDLEKLLRILADEVKRTNLKSLEVDSA